MRSISQLLLPGALLCAATLALPRATASQPPSASPYAQRRAALLDRLPDGALLVLGAREPEQDYLSFWQAPSFSYLTGFLEPDAALVMIKSDAGATGTLFVQPRDPAREVWTGYRLGVDRTLETTGLPGRDAADLFDVLDSLAGRGLPLFVIGDLGGGDLSSTAVLSPDQQLVAALERRHPGLKVRVANAYVEQLRGHKSPEERALIRHAVEITDEAQREAMRAMAPGRNEYEIQALIEYTFRRLGADRPAFSTIVGSGPNATTLHYNADNRPIEAGDLVVMDIGASFGGYAADVTRTVPASGRFTAEQRAIYQIVRDAQSAAERQATPGADAERMSDSATAVLAAGLTRLGLIESPAATYECGSVNHLSRCAQYTLFYPHALGHGIGLEVHDPDQYYFTRRLAPGSAFTIEPGIYVRGDVLDVLPNTPANRTLIAKLRPAVTRYRNIGVRIEDDYLITEQGLERLSTAPREIGEIEKAANRESGSGSRK